MSSDRSQGCNEEAKSGPRCRVSSQSKGRSWQETVNQLKKQTSHRAPWARSHILSPTHPVCCSPARTPATSLGDIGASTRTRIKAWSAPENNTCVLKYSIFFFLFNYRPGCINGMGNKCPSRGEPAIKGEPEHHQSLFTGFREYYRICQEVVQSLSWLWRQLCKLR